MNPTEIEFAVRDLVAKPYDAGSFPYDLIAIYNASKVTVSRLKSGQTNAAKQPGDVLWKKHLFFRPAEPGADVGAIGDALAADPLTAKHKPRFIVVTNGEQVHARDLGVDDTLNIEYARLDERSDFLLPLAGYERRAAIEEHPADIKAAKKLKKLYDAILSANPTWSSGHHTHELNLLMTRLLFCFYAEDTGIFDTPQLFTNTLTQYTAEDGSDVAPLLDRLFRIMNVENGKRPGNTPAIDAKFPYVNGSLFEDSVEIPTFNRTARRQLLECGDLDWTTINPDIFGSMIQTIAQDGTRSDLGMHYTSVPNIMKVLQPLFLDDLNETYEKAKDSVPKLEALLGRLAKIRVFDPACGSGNFLIIAYKALRNLETRILVRIGEIGKAPLRLSGVSLQNFFGIDVVDFACETTKLSLWIAEHQSNVVFQNLFGVVRPSLPLAKIKTVHCGNAVRLDWQTICPHDASSETFICANPPYSGSSNQTASQKADIDFIFSSRTKGYKNIDYVGCWILKAVEYLALPNTRAAFVATSSVCQGEQVPILWPLIYTRSIEISFAHAPFDWQNNASHNAGVVCVIIGLCQAKTVATKRLFQNDLERSVQVIGPYLIPGNETVVQKAPTALNGLPPAVWGNKPTDGGNLILSPDEYRRLTSAYPASQRFLRRYYGADEVIHSIERWCLWIEDDLLDAAVSIPPINERINRVKEMRLKSRAPSTVEYAKWPHRFRQVQDHGKPALVIPEISSYRRQYLQIALLDAESMANNKLYVVYDPPAFLMALLSSRMHQIWAATVGGRMGWSIQYSTSLVYNTLPVPALSSEQKRILSDHSRAIVRARSKHPGKTIAELYNPETMPENLLQAHVENDAYLEEMVYGRQFKDDTHRLEHLFALYARMASRAQSQASLLGVSKETQAV